MFSRILSSQQSPKKCRKQEMSTTERSTIVQTSSDDEFVSSAMNQQDMVLNSSRLRKLKTQSSLSGTDVKFHSTKRRPIVSDNSDIEVFEDENIGREGSDAEKQSQESSSSSVITLSSGSSLDVNGSISSSGESKSTRTSSESDSTRSSSTSSLFDQERDETPAFASSQRRRSHPLISELPLQRRSSSADDGSLILTVKRSQKRHSSPAIAPSSLNNSKKPLNPSSSVSPYQSKPVQSASMKLSQAMNLKLSQPLNSKSIEPSNSKPIQPLNSKSIEPSNSKPIQPLNSKSTEPSNSKPIQPLNSKSIESSHPKPIQPSNSKSIQPSNSKSTELLNLKPIQPLNSKPIQPLNPIPSTPTNPKPSNLSTPLSKSHPSTSILSKPRASKSSKSSKSWKYTPLHTPQLLLPHPDNALSIIDIYSYTPPFDQLAIRPAPKQQLRNWIEAPLAPSLCILHGPPGSGKVETRTRYSIVAIVFAKPRHRMQPVSLFLRCYGGYSYFQRRSHNPNGPICELGPKWIYVP